jgi:hypothetical protein
MKTELSVEEAAIIGIVRINKATPRLEIKKNWSIGKLHFQFNWRSKKNLWGRFGGGWNWEFGFQSLGSTIIFMLLICTLRVNWK